mmetsp:Transcript_40155/g.55853  ORF Transcript_40155/g.55853 Transcript_40155/m.55853 type:complete len:487 (-) Transcript_40155:115-1575(-)
MDKIVLKLKFEDQIRRVNLVERPLTINEVNQTIQKLFPNVGAYDLSYLDEEGDCIFLETDLELREALEVSMMKSPGQTPLIRLDMNLKESDNPSSSEPKEKPTPQPSEKNSVRLSSIFPKEILFHPFSKQLASLGEDLLKQQEAMQTSPFLFSVMSCCGPLLSQANKLKKIAESVAKGEDPLIEDPLMIELLREQAQSINKEELLKKFDAMDAGLKKNRSENVSLPLYLQVFRLWMNGGNAEPAAQSNSPFGGALFGNGNCGFVGGCPGFSQPPCFQPPPPGMPGMPGMFCANPLFNFSGNVGGNEFSFNVPSSPKPSVSSSYDVDNMSVAEMKRLLSQRRVSFRGIADKDDLKKLFRETFNVPSPSPSPPSPSPPSSSESVLPEKPVVSEPVVSEPVVSEPVVSEPVVSEPIVSEREEPAPFMESFFETEEDKEAKIEEEKKREEALKTLVGMGFDEALVVVVLDELPKVDVNAAVERLFTYVLE